MLICKENGRLVGIATQGEETVSLENPMQDGNQFMWSMKVKKLMRLSLKFNVTIEENNMYGEARAGMLPASKLTGQRVS